MRPMTMSLPCNLVSKYSLHAWTVISLTEHSKDKKDKKKEKKEINNINE